MIDPERLRHEAIRLHTRYCVEIVEGLGFCPWAEEARVRGRLAIVPCVEEEASVAWVLGAIDRVEADPQLEIGLLAFPLCRLERLAFSHFVAEVRAADAARKPAGAVVLAMADFHPDAPLDQTSAERMVPFVRRSPDPAIQLVRKDALARVRMSDDQGTSFLDLSQLSMDALLSAPAKPLPLAARVAQSNWKTVERLGLEDVEARFDAIARDREETYAALGVPRAPWAERARVSASET